MASGYYKGSDVSVSAPPGCVLIATVARAQGVVLVYDITNKTSLANVRRWVTELRSRVDSVELTVVGNKSDMEEARQISFEEGKAIAADVGAGGFFETSCRTGTNIQNVYVSLARRALKGKLSVSSKPVPRTVDVAESEASTPVASSSSGGCC
jgi:GTPase SAR1 family protein